ncbi:DUF202 domain-containing protein [Sulfitobacter albidus]|uniref:DUF202 domain-containing protein n=1 Tax=Sulfitobacter albidus TaxID=2829501 RepID=A0A975JC97_9RHOB|nr:DUF202 domain-containing protein [Sulfitobacter albidus]QUJ75832.1 DUF202 domain-containing protein [Sulfitobacter albidus]
MAQKNKLAQDRTDWAEDRTILANERTFAGWMRTGMAATALAVGLNAVFAEAEPTWLPKAVASLFITLSLFIFWAAERSAARTLKRLQDNEAHAQPSGRMRLIAILLGLGAVCVGGVLWML